MLKSLTILVFLSLFALSGCKSPIPDPQNIDPIYNEYKKELEHLKAEKEKLKQDLDKLQASAEKAEPQTGEKRELLENYFEMKKIMEKKTERELYLEKKIEERLLFDRKSYKEAFDNNKPWPDSKEIEQHRLEEKLESRRGKAFKVQEWDPQRRIEKLLPKKPTPPPEKAEGSGH